MKVFLKNAFLKGVPSIFVRLKEHYLDKEKVREKMEGAQEVAVGLREGTGGHTGGGSGVEGGDRRAHRRWQWGGGRGREGTQEMAVGWREETGGHTGGGGGVGGGTGGHTGGGSGVEGGTGGHTGGGSGVEGGDTRVTSNVSCPSQGAIIGSIAEEFLQTLETCGKLCPEGELEGRSVSLSLS